MLTVVGLVFPLSNLSTEPSGLCFPYLCLLGIDTRTKVREWPLAWHCPDSGECRKLSHSPTVLSTLVTHISFSGEPVMQGFIIPFHIPGNWSTALTFCFTVSVLLKNSFRPVQELGYNSVIEHMLSMYEALDFTFSTHCP